MIILNFFINLIFSFFIIKEDIKNRKILNNYLVKYIFLLISFKIIDFFLYPIAFNYQLIQYFILSIVLPFILYLFKIWGAGDSKLLTLYLLSIPNIILEKFYYIYLLRYLNFLFIISCSIYIILGVIKVLKLKKIDLNKEKIIFNLNYLLFIILFLNLINSIIYIKINLNNYIFIFFNLVIIFLIQRFIVPKLSRKKIYISLIILALLNIKLINLIFIFRIAFAILIFFLKEIITFSEKEEIPVENLKIGDIISKKALDKFSNSRVKQLPKLDINSKKNFYILKNIEEIDAIKRWKNSKYGEEKVEIEKSIPFSIYICFSYFITVFYCLYILKGC